MAKWLSRLYNLHHYPGILERRQAIAAYVLITAGLPIVFLSSVLDPNFYRFDPWSYVSIAAMALLIVLWFVARQGYLRIVRIVLLGMLYLVTAFYPLVGTTVITSALLQHVMLIGAAILAQERGVLLGLAACLVGDIVIWVHLSPTEPPDKLIGAMTAIVAFSILTGVLSYMLAQGWRRGLAYAGEQVIAQRLRMAELNAEITQRIFRRMNLATLLDEAVELVRDRFDKIYHAQIFLVDAETQQQAVLRASTGPVGRELLRRHHMLPVGSQSVIGQATLRSQPVLVSDTSRDPIHRRNDLLPDTRAELALPLVSQDRIIGALDVQSTEPDAFTPDDVAMLQALANLIALAIDNARLFDEQHAAITENERLVALSKNQLAEIEALNRRLTGQAWGSFLREQDLAPALTVEFDSGAMTPNAAWTPSLTRATEQGTVIDERADGRRVLAVPISVRGQVIGAMEFELDDGAPATGDMVLPPEMQTALAQGVAERLALAVENARLYEDARRLARRETVINEISAQLQAASGIEHALAAAAQGLQTALKAPRVAIRLGAPPATPDGSPSNGQEAQA